MKSYNYRQLNKPFFEIVSHYHCTRTSLPVASQKKQKKVSKKKKKWGSEPFFSVNEQYKLHYTYMVPHMKKTFQRICIERKRGLNISEGIWT